MVFVTKTDIRHRVWCSSRNEKTIVKACRCYIRIFVDHVCLGVFDVAFLSVFYKLLEKSERRLSRRLLVASDLCRFNKNLRNKNNQHPVLFCPIVVTTINFLYFFLFLSFFWQKQAKLGKMDVVHGFWEENAAMHHRVKYER